jgi:hypothetical protein
VGNFIATNKKNKRFTPKDNITIRGFKEEHFFVPKFHWYSVTSIQLAADIKKEFC